MEGIGSRPGRASSRYGPVTTATFTGPVRKWKKQWVHVSPSHTTKTNTTNTGVATSALRLCRWTPLPLTPPVDDNLDEPPRRKFRYTPVVDLEERKSEGTNKVDGISKPRKARPLTIETISHSDDTNGAPTEKNQATYEDLKHSSVGLINLKFDLNSLDEDSESESEVELPEIVKASSPGYWS